MEDLRELHFIREEATLNLPPCPVVFGERPIYLNPDPDKYPELPQRIYDALCSFCIHEPGEAIREGCLNDIDRPHWYCNLPVVGRYEGRVCLVHCARYNPVPDPNHAGDLGWRCEGFDYCGREWSEEAGLSIITPEDVRKIAGKERMPDDKKLKSFLNKALWNGERMHPDYRQELRDFMTRWEAGGRHIENITLDFHPNPQAPRRRDWSPILTRRLELVERSYR